MLQKFKSVLFIFFIYVSLTTCSEAIFDISDSELNHNYSYYDNYLNGTPNFEIYSYSTYVEANNGEDISIFYYITGAGYAEKNKIRISIPPDLCEGDAKFTTIEVEYDNESDVYHLFPSTNTTGPQAAGTLSQYYFNRRGEGYSNWGEMIIGNTDGTNSTPLSISFKVADNVPSGNYEVIFFLFYEYDDIWYLSEETVTVHVRNWYEKTWGIIFTYLVGGITVISIVYNSVKEKYPPKSKTNTIECSTCKGTGKK